MKKTDVLIQQFRDFITDERFPCVGAKAALSKGKMHVIVARHLDSNWDDRRIYSGLEDIVASYRKDRSLFQSFAVIFEGPHGIDEEEFEQLLWSRAESLTNKDVWSGRPKDKRVSSDPDDPHFSLSFNGEAFFIVGLHPNASRPARRFRRPAMVFNLHDQFEQLRALGKYEKMKEKIIERDVALAGDANPMLAMHGTISEARQYSGRVVDSEWKCPFNPVARP